MGLYWNPWAVVGCIDLVLGWALAIAIYATNPTRLQNRALALFLAMLATGFGVGVGLMFAADDAVTSLALQAVSLAGFYCAAPFYLLFLSTLPTRTMRWLRPTWIRALLWLSPLAIVPLMLANFDALVAGVIEVPYARQDSYWTRTGTLVFEAIALVTATLGIVAAVGVYRESPPGSATRRQARWYGATFITWEVLQLTGFTLLEIAFRSPTPSILLYTLAAGILYPLACLLFVLMLAYSILKAQLFDIDLRIKWTINRGTVAAVFVVVFFVVSEGAQLVFQERVGAWAGLAAAALLVFALAPVQRFADRLTERAMPAVEGSPAYLQFRKLEVYKGAFEAAQEDGEVTERERAVLDRLRRELGVESADAAAIERDVLELKARHSGRHVG
ncbi:MAG TPA: hypothetical protein VFH78_04710 [Candidatus Thermoplasmatota archaeon]|nr:hypothetical protein [Candidatus Thermoplasmatota archaeon]